MKTPYRLLKELNMSHTQLRYASCILTHSTLESKCIRSFAISLPGSSLFLPYLCLREEDGAPWVRDCHLFRWSREISKKRGRIVELVGCVDVTSKRLTFATSEPFFHNQYFCISIVYRVHAHIRWFAWDKIPPLIECCRWKRNYFSQHDVVFIREI